MNKILEAIRTEWRNGGLKACLNGTDVYSMYDRAKSDRVTRWQNQAEPDKSSKTCTMAYVDWAVAQALGVSTQSLHLNRRARVIVEPRWLAMLLMSKHCTNCSLVRIGRHFNLDHTTVIHGIRQMKKLLVDDPDWLDAHDRAQNILAGVDG